MYGSPDFAAIAAQILDKSFSTDGLVPTHEQADSYFGGHAPHASGVACGVEAKAKEAHPQPKITVAAAKQNMATVAARIAAIEDKANAENGREVCLFLINNINLIINN